MANRVLTEEQKQAHREANYQWRRNNPEKRAQQVAKNYSKNGNSRRKWHPWSAEEDDRVIAHAIADRELAWELGRTLRSIHIRRSLLRKRYPERFTGEKSAPQSNLSVAHYMFSGKRLRFWREQRGWTQEKCERLLGVGRNRMGEWESGRRTPDANNTLRLCILLMIGPVDLSEPLEGEQ